jgi:hypothetical protein
VEILDREGLESVACECYRAAHLDSGYFARAVLGEDALHR